MRKRYPVRPPAPVGDLFVATCRHCGGNGFEPGLGDLTCRECMGRGRRKWRIEECQSCRGGGRKQLIFKCPDCRGRGWQERDVG